MTKETNDSTPEPGFSAKQGSSAGMPKVGWLIDNPEQIVCAVDSAYVAIVASKPDAGKCNEEYHRNVFDAASHGAIVAQSKICEDSSREERQLRDEHAKVTAEMDRTPREFIGPGGGQVRTWPRLLMAIFFVIGGFGCAFIDVCLMVSLVGDAEPERLSDLPYMAGLMALPLIGVLAMKGSSMLAPQDPEALKRRSTLWSRILWVAVPMILLSIAYRWLELTTIPSVNLAIEPADPLHKYGALVVCFFSLGANAIVSTGSLLVARQIFADTTPATRTPNLAWQSLDARRAAIAGQLQVLEGRLAIQSAQLETLLATRDKFLGEAETELGIELDKLANRQKEEAKLAKLEADAERLRVEERAAAEAETKRILDHHAETEKRIKQQHADAEQARKDIEIRLDQLRKEALAHREQLHKETATVLEAQRKAREEHERKLTERREKSAQDIQVERDRILEGLGSHN